MRNRTTVWILQHPRERFHPIGTARIARLGLERLRLEVCFRSSETRPPTLPDDAALLYPGGDAPTLAALTADRRPSALVVIDGTWAHAHTIHRDNPWLHDLPRYSLNPTSPSRYRIRREPDRDCLSTIEAIVQALTLLEPETSGLDRLLGAFDSMIDDQVRFAEQHASDRHASNRGASSRHARHVQAVPRAFAQRDRLVVVYGESSASVEARQRDKRQVAQWTAVRAATGELFERFIAPRHAALDARHLAHMGLAADAMHSAISVEQLRQDWERFRRPSDLVLAWNQSTLDVMHGWLGVEPPAILLKAAYCNTHGGPCGTLEAVVQRRGITPHALDLRGRARQRLGNALALVNWLQP